MVSLRSSRRKQQTRLSFNPLPTSSPAASALPEQIQSRAAAVRYDTTVSPTKKRRLLSSSGQAKLDFDSTSRVGDKSHSKVALPTPEPSSQIDAEHQHGRPQSLPSTSISEEDEPITPKKNRRLRSARTGFMGTRELGDLSGWSTPLDEEKRKRSDFILGHGATPLYPSMELSVSDESDASSPRKRINKVHKITPQATPKSSITVNTDEESEPIAAMSTKRERREPQSIPETPQNSRLSRFPTSSSRLRFKQVSVPIGRLHRNTTVTPTRSSKRAIAARHQDVKSTERHTNWASQSRRQVEPESDDSSDSLMNELRASTSKPEPKHIDGPESSEDPDDAGVITPRRRRRKPYIELSSSVDRSDAENGRRTLNGRPNDKDKRKRLTRVKRPATGKSNRQKQLELLRKRRAGETVDPPSENDSLEVDEQDSEATADPSEPMDEADEDSGTERVRQAINIPSNLDEYEEDFVDDDDDDNDDGNGALVDLTDIPLEFTRHAHKKPIEHFKDVVEWMIHNKLNPAFARNDPVYMIAVRKLDDVVQGYAGSKFMSAAWKAEFLAALKKYPDCTRVDIATMFDQKCEACGRSGHPAKHQLIFSGKPYHRETLEDNTSDEEDTDEPDNESQPLSTNVKSFFLGRTCNANAETAHTLYHWRHQLNFFVLNLLRTEGYFTPEKILERSNWNTKRKERYANAVVDGMEADGQMKDLYMEFKQNLEAARETKNEGNYFYGRSK
ncbi:MAG: hypothetical protein Q9209_003500 [Squamulea sp. 1 TL-2023]